MADRIVVFGATGYTGELIASRLVALGARPVLAGRSEHRLSALAERLGGLEWARADAMRQNTVFDLVGPDDVLISTVGPFSKWGLPAARAAVAAGCTYIDTTGEPEFIRRVFEQLDEPARRSGARLIPSLSYEFAARSLAGALALEEAGEDAVRVDIGYYALGAGPTSLSAGTRESWSGSRWATTTRSATAASSPSAPRSGSVRSKRPGSHARRSRSAAPSTTGCPVRTAGCARSTCTWAGSGHCRAR